MIILLKFIATWILLTFTLYYIIALLVNDSNHTKGILKLGAVLAFAISILIIL